MKVRNLVTHSDRCRLGQLLMSDDVRGIASRQQLDELEWHLEESDAVRPEFVPEDVVTMNSTVRFVSVCTSAEMTCTVVYPDDTDLVDNGISVLEPLGARLVGCKVGDLVEWGRQMDPGPWRIIEVVFQPERSDKFEL